MSEGRSTRPGVLLLDVMDTIVHDPFFVEVPRFLGMTLEEIFASKDNGAWIEFERGAIDESTYLARFFRDRREFDGGALRDCIHAGYRWIDGVESLLADVRDAGHTPHALSNYPSWYRQIDARLGLGRYLDWTFVSCRTGVRKPAPEAYLGAASHLGVDPGSCVFVDDREPNCAAAREAGMTAVRFEGADALRGELEALRFL